MSNENGCAVTGAVIDCASPEVLGWNIGNCMDADFCVKALDMALSTGRKPMVINTDQKGASTHRTHG